MQAESSLRALLRAATSLRSIQSTSLALVSRNQDQHRASSRTHDESGRPSFTPRRPEGSNEGERAFRLRREEGHERGRRIDGSAYKGDFESRLERSIERIGSRERRPTNAAPRRGEYRDGPTKRPGYQGRNGDGRKGFRSRDNNAIDISRSSPRKAGFGLRKPSPDDPASSRESDISSRKYMEVNHSRTQNETPSRISIASSTDARSSPLPRARERPSSPPHRVNASPDETQMPWRPAKKLTYQAMAALRALHTNDPKTFDKDALSERFGISYEAVSRILKSKYQDQKAGDVGESIQGTKWDLDARSSANSPVPALRRAFARVQQGKQRIGSDSAKPAEGSTG